MTAASLSLGGAVDFPVEVVDGTDAPSICEYLYETDFHI
jgi:hypothetical protein